MTVHEVATANGHEQVERSSCFFEWILLPQHHVRDSPLKFKCDLCSIEVEGVASLKLHQIGQHINPYYLSASDRIIAQINSYVVQTDKTEGPWIPDWDTFKGLYRCHECFLVCNDGADLTKHLESHSSSQVIADVSNEEDKLDDLEDVPLVKRLKSPPKKANGKVLESSPTSKKSKKSPEQTEMYKNHKRRSKDPEDPTNDDNDEDVPLAKKLKSSPVSPTKRPDRKCKSTTNTLVAMLTADERYFDSEMEKSLLIAENSAPARKEAHHKVAVSAKESKNAKESSNGKKKRGKVKKFYKAKCKRGRKRKAMDVDLIKIPAPVNANPLRSSKRSSALLAERISLILNDFTSLDRPFACLDCKQFFPSYAELSQHKEGEHTSKKKRPTIMMMTASRIGKKATLVNEADSYDPEFHEYVSSAVKIVPETTFNNMHGTLEHISSVDALEYQSKPMGTVDKVKMNVSGSWSKTDVWERGWEVSNDMLNWNHFDRKFLQNMSHISWSQQRLFHQVFQQGHYGETASAMKKELHNQKNLISGLDLKQMGKSVKSLTALERRQAKKAATKASKERPLKKGFLNGEWESPHDFMCSSCATVYDELREVLHHKWEAHPYCLVAHVTLRTDLNLPPSNLMHPQTGRNMTKHKMVRTMGGGGPKKASLKADNAPVAAELKCSKCSESSFEDRNAFYVHVLECGGQVDWDSTKKKKKKRTRVLRRTNSTENNDEAALRRKARFERFNRPPPMAVQNGGRMTRRQADLIKKERKMKAKGRKAGGRKKSAKKAPAVLKKEEGEEGNDIPNNQGKVSRRRIVHRSVIPNVDRQRRSTAFYGFSTGDSTPVLDDDNNEVKKIVTQIMEEMLEKVEKAALVLDEAKKRNLDLEKAKDEIFKRRRSSLDSNGSGITHITFHGEPLEEIVDMIKPANDDEEDEVTEDVKLEQGTEIVNKRRSSFAASFYSSQPTSERSLRRSTGRVSYMDDPQDIIDDEALDAAPLIRRKKRSSLLANSVSQDIKEENEVEESSLEDDQKTDKSSFVKVEEVEPMEIEDEILEEFQEKASSPPSRRSSRSQSLNEESGGEDRPRRHLNNNLMLDSAVSSCSRVVFPLEVKVCAIQRIRDGATKVQVARDLQCPLSTVSSWWQRRSSLIPELADSASASESENSDTSIPTAEASSSSPKKVGRPPKQKRRKSLDLNRTVLISQMKERVEAAFVAQEESESFDDDDDGSDQSQPMLEENDNEEAELKIIQEPEPNNDAVIETRDEVKADKLIVPPGSEESSNDAAEFEEGSSKVVNKNTILRNCFASLHRRQQMEKEQQYNQYLND